MKPSPYIAFIPVLLLLLVSSCISFNTTGMKYLSPQQRERITRANAPLDQLPFNDTIYLVNDSMVREWLDGKEYAIVHSFLTWCKGEYCINPAIAVNDLRETGLPFLMIAGDLESKNGYRADYPFMCVDFDYYQTKNSAKAVESLFGALGCKKDWWQLYFLFNDGKYVGCSQTLAELMQMYATQKES